MTEPMTAERLLHIETMAGQAQYRPIERAMAEYVHELVAEVRRLKDAQTPLAAAAPDLLQACEAMLRFGVPARLVDGVNAAVRKARGKQ